MRTQLCFLESNRETRMEGNPVRMEKNYRMEKSPVKREKNMSGYVYGLRPHDSPISISRSPCPGGQLGFSSKFSRGKDL